MSRKWTARSGVLFGALAVVVSFGPAAFAAGGLSTPGVTVTAQNPGTSSAGSDLRITLTAHTEKSTVPNPDCRPGSATLTCWGSLVLRIPDAGGMSVTGFQVHRVAVGDIGCVDEGSGGCENDMAATAEPPPYPVQAQVNGVAVLTDPGTLTYPPGTPQAGEPVPPGTAVQLKITLTDNGTAQYQDQADVQVNLFVTGSVKPLLYDTGPQPVQQAQIHFEGGH
jgi:hypothetical protein